MTIASQFIFAVWFFKKKACSVYLSTLKQKYESFIGKLDE